MSDYLPEEVVVEILARLPVKSLLKFRCVSKSWNSRITSSSFFKIQLEKAKASKYQPKLLLTRYMSSKSQYEQYSLRFDNGDFDLYAAFTSPVQAKGAYFRIVGVCNGLICLSDDMFGYQYTIIIWNPSIRRYLRLPRPAINFDSSGPYMFVLGFGFDVQRNECKVVRLAYLQSPSGSIIHKSTPIVEVYAASSGSWETIKHGVSSCNVVDFMYTQVFLNGSVHWAAYKSHGKATHNVVLSFDMAAEKFAMMEFPQPFVDVFPAHFCIGLYQDLLALFVYDNLVDCKVFGVHVMKEYGAADSWSRLLRVEMNDGIRTLLGFREDGEALIVTKDDVLVSVEPNSKQTKNMGISGYVGSLYAAACEESLALLNGLSGELAGRLESYEIPVAAEDSLDDENEEYGKRINGRITMQRLFAAAAVPGFPMPQ